MQQTAKMTPIQSGRMTLDRVHHIFEHRPRLAEALCEGSSTSGYGRIGFRELVRLTELGYLIRGRSHVLFYVRP